MRIYISGICGTGMGPLALMARAAGHEVSGSDKSKGAIYNELIKAGIKVYIGEQDGEEFEAELARGVDWYVYSSAIEAGHPEFEKARAAGLRCTKRDDLTADLVENLGLKMVAVAGTHGKTTTTAMIVWAAEKLGLPVAYVVGTTLGFAPSGAYHVGDRFFIYEADEYDRNFLKFHPWLAVIPYVSYDHPDIYKTEAEYLAAFSQFEGQCEKIIKKTVNGVEWRNIGAPNYAAEDFGLAGVVRRTDASLAAVAVEEMLSELGREACREEVIKVLDVFPGVGRRFERLAEGIYTDYAHHPEEIAATIAVAQEQAMAEGRKGVVVAYQPHQNTRQHEVRAGYPEAFRGADKVYWLPTYLARENPELKILSAEELIAGIPQAEVAAIDDELFMKMVEWRDAGYLVVLMTAGPADGWLRGKLR